MNFIYLQMKHIIIGSLLLVSSFNCKSQEKEDVRSKNYQKQETTRDEPIYTLKISVANRYETYVNDMPLEKDFKNGSTTTQLPINNFILKSGVQKIKIIIYPDSGNLLVDGSGRDYVNVKIYKYPHGIDNMQQDDATLISETNLKDLALAPIVKKEFEISANVPYEVDGWIKSVDLSKENQEAFKKEVAQKYEELRTLLINRKGDEFLKILAKRDAELNKALYLSDSDINEENTDDLNCINNITSVLKIENYKMEIHGEGRIVTLTRIDGNLNGESVLQAKYGKYTRVYDIYLHRPKPGAPLEIIR